MKYITNKETYLVSNNCVFKKQQKVNIIFYFTASQILSNVATTFLPDPVDNQELDNLLAIENLVNKLNSGVDIGQNILMTYRISVNIEIPYCILIENDDHMKMLKDALADDCRNKIEVVHDCIEVYKWTKEKVNCTPNT